jgi:CheY-like chemotaxis protein
MRDEEMLAALGYEPVGFATADAAVAACRSRPERFDALVVGHFGSAIASLQLAAALRDATPDLPIVLAAKFAQEIGADTLLAAGIADVVHWPIVAAEIAPALHHCLTQTHFDAAAMPSSARGARALAH